MRMTFEEWFFSNKEKIIDLYNRETDPNYDCKVAYARGKKIQYRNKDSSDLWKNCAKEPYWTEACEYRVKPEERKCNSCQYQCEPDMPCTTCEDYGNYKPRIAMQGEWVDTKKKRRMTYREFAKWVAQGNGQVKNVDGCYITSRGVEYDIGDDDKPCPDRLMIRGWDETEWSEPLIEE